jgi:signal transduction histidine kinase
MMIKDTRHRMETLPSWAIDTAIAIGLALLACIQIWLFDRFRPPMLAPSPGGPGIPETSLVPYLLVIGVFLPLALRRVWPWVALAVSAFFAILYGYHPGPATFTMLGPMIGMYSVAAYARRRYSGLVALLVTGLVVAVPAIAFTSTRGAAQAVGTFALLAAAMLFGDTTRNRREYVAEVEHRAAETEQRMEEEALRRVEEERMRIAREVHDIVAHSLSIVTVQSAAATALIDSDPERARESIEHVRATSKQALTELRSVLDVLRTGEGDAPLAPTADITQVESLIEPVREAGLTVDLEVQGDLTTVPAFASVSAYRIVQEALTNVVRHARARSVRISLAQQTGHLEIEVSDDGDSSSAAESAGHGLRGMRERVEALGGTFASGSSDGGGYAVRATIPLTRGTTP